MTTVGPLLLALCVEMTGSYSTMFYILAATVGVCASAAAAVRMPARLALEREPHPKLNMTRRPG